MQPHDFVEHHLPALEADEARHNLILFILARLQSDASVDIRRWSLGAAGQCAVQWPKRPIVLGDVDETQARALAETTIGLDYPGVVGPDLTAQYFVDPASALGVNFCRRSRNGFMR